MKPRSIGVFCIVSAFAITPILLAQQSTPSQEHKAPSAEPKAVKKPNIIVFNPSGTPKPTQKPGRPKGVPVFHPLSKDQKITIVQGIPGLPQSFSSVAPYLTLSPMHVLDPRGALDLHWPALTSWASAIYDAFPSDDGEARSFNAKTVQVFLAADADAPTFYLVDFDVFTFAAVSFQVTVEGMDPIPCKQFPPGESYVAAPIYNISQSGRIYSVILQVCPPPTSGASPYPEWVFGFAEVTKFVPSST